jgi:hypothetical protein
VIREEKPVTDTIDFKSLRKTAMTVLTGDYAVVVDKVTYKKTQKDQPMWMVALKVTAGPFAGRVVNLNLVLSTDHQFMMQRFFGFMEALGADEAFFDASPTNEAVCAQIQGRHAIATFEESKTEFRGAKSEEVKALVAAGVGGVTVATTGVSLAATSLPKATSLPAATTATVATDASAPPADPF